MDRSRLFLSTTAADAAEVAREYGLGLELAEFCTAWNMDDELLPTQAALEKTLAGLTAPVLHAPFNELFPCAIDRQARQLAARRYRQAIALAHEYGAKKVVIHAGFNPWLYYPVWFTEQSVPFWKEFLQEDPGVELVLENVLEPEPSWLLDIVRAVDDPRLKVCVDIGHVHAYAKTPIGQWLEEGRELISHFHIHNNDSSWDTHNPLFDGTIDIRGILETAEKYCPGATYTLELLQARESVAWLLEGDANGNETA